jgi:hypothetical protein
MVTCHLKRRCQLYIVVRPAFIAETFAGGDACMLAAGQRHPSHSSQKAQFSELG